jgi:predicted transposase YdaD
MQQSVIYQEWIEEGSEESRVEGERSLILRRLTRRIRDLVPEVRSQIQSFSLTQLESLGEALLDFSCLLQNVAPQQSQEPAVKTYLDWAVMHQGAPDSPKPCLAIFWHRWI